MIFIKYEKTKSVEYKQLGPMNMTENLLKTIKIISYDTLKYEGIKENKMIILFKIQKYKQENIEDPSNDFFKYIIKE
jgi:hypothetical protein